jgi:phage shock protein C
MEEIKMEKRLYKSNTNKMLCGVCGGIAEYFNIDPTLVRLGWVIFSLAGGSGVLAYIIAAIIIPDESNIV